MAEEKKTGHNPSKPRHGKSMGICIKCNNSYKLKRNTKHSHFKVIRGLCPTCAGKKAEVAVE